MRNTKRAVLRAPGKINLSLDITGKRDDGYHNIETVMHAVGLCDIVLVGTGGGEEISITASCPIVSRDGDNIAYKAAGLFLSRLGITGQGITIHIDKVLPMQSGLAGGSADAAAVLVGLNYLLGTGLGEDELCSLGAEIGADVPFCITGGCKRATGKGEILTDLPLLPKCTILVAKPEVGIDTRQAYNFYSRHSGRLKRPDTPSIVKAMENGDLGSIGKQMVNVFENLAPIKKVMLIKEQMLSQGAAGAVMTGSGSAVAGLFENEYATHICHSQLKGITDEIYITKPCKTGTEIIYAD